MEPRISFITLGVFDLDRATRFYEQVLKLPRVPMPDGAGVSFFEMGRTWLSLFPREELAQDAGVSAEGSGFAGFTLAHNLGSMAAVDALFIELRGAGVKIVKEPARASWGGYCGYFADSEGLAPRHGVRAQRGGCGRGAYSRLPHPLLRSHRVGANWEVAWNPHFPHA